MLREAASVCWLADCWRMLTCLSAVDWSPQRLMLCEYHLVRNMLWRTSVWRCQRIDLTQLMRIPFVRECRARALFARLCDMLGVVYIFQQRITVHICTYMT